MKRNQDELGNCCPFLIIFVDECFSFENTFAMLIQSARPCSACHRIILVTLVSRYVLACIATLFSCSHGRRRGLLVGCCACPRGFQLFLGDKVGALMGFNVAGQGEE